MTPAALLQAAERRRTAETDYRSAVLAALDTFGAAETARTLGVSRQAVYQLAERARNDRGRLETRLAELDTRWQALIAERASAYCLKDAAAITAGRNGRAKIRAKKGLPKLRTVKQEAFALAETELLRLLADDVAVERHNLEQVRRDVAELHTIQNRLESLTDDIPF